MRDGIPTLIKRYSIKRTRHRALGHGPWKRGGTGANTWDNRSIDGWQKAGPCVRTANSRGETCCTSTTITPCGPVATGPIHSMCNGKCRRNTSSTCRDRPNQIGTHWITDLLRTYSPTRSCVVWKSFGRDRT